MTRVTGTIEIDFDTMNTVNEETKKKFEHTLEQNMEAIENCFYEVAFKHGIIIDSMHPVLLGNIEISEGE